MPNGAKGRHSKVRLVRKDLTVSVAERQRAFSAVYPGTWTCETRHVDEEPFVSLLSQRCDYAIALQTDKDEKKNFFFIELKGEDVCRAAEQLAFTILNYKSYKSVLDWNAYPQKHACIVSSRGHRPCILTKYQRIKVSMEKMGFVVHEKVHAMRGWVSKDGSFRVRD